MQFARVLQTLCDGDVEFVVIDGVAAALQGSTRMTFDVDICYARTPSNLRRLAAVLAPFHPRLRDLPPELLFVWDEATLRIGDIDLLAEVAGVGAYERALARSVRATACGRDFPVLDLRALIDAKRAAGRPKDTEALPELESLAEAAETD